MNSLKIEQVAVQTGLTKRTIRYYEEIGLLPAPERSPKGIRYYAQEHIELLKKIKSAKEALGFSLQELQHYIELGNTIETQKINYKHSSERAEQKENLEKIINTLQKRLDLVEQRIHKIKQVRNDIKDLIKRAQNFVDTIEQEENANK